MLAELGHIRGCGAEVEFDLLDGAAIQRLEPALSGSVRAAIRLRGQRCILVRAIADHGRAHRRPGRARRTRPVASVRRHAEGRSILIITHRLASVRHADRTYVLHDGRVIEQGGHAELIALGGKYAEPYALQASQYDTVQ